MKKIVPLVLVSIMLVLGMAQPVMAFKTPTPIGEDPLIKEELSTETDAGSIINNVVLYLTYILAGLFVLMIIIGAIMYMVYPDAEKKQKGMSIIQAAIIAGVLALLSYAIWNILDNLL